MSVSRSYKKTPIVKDNVGGRKYAKLQANKRVRRKKYVSNGKQYRKVYNTWDINDYVSYCTLKEFLDFAHLWKFYKTEEEMTQAWRRSYYNK